MEWEQQILRQKIIEFCAAGTKDAEAALEVTLSKLSVALVEVGLNQVLLLSLSDSQQIHPRYHHLVACMWLTMRKEKPVVIRKSLAALVLL